MSDPLAPPAGFAIGHWSAPSGATGCTAVIAPPGSRGAVDVRGGGPGTRETDVIGPLAGTAEVTAVVLAGGSAYGLAAADGAMRWLEERGRGYSTPGGRVPIVPAAVIYDGSVGDREGRPDAESGRLACESAAEGVPERGAVGAGAGAAVGKLLGRERAAPAGVGYAAARAGAGEVVAAIAVVNAFGDVVGADGEVLAGPRGDDGRLLRTSELLTGMDAPPEWTGMRERNTTLVCLMTDAGLDRAACNRVARMASGGVARAVDPAYSDVDGDVAFCLASGTPRPDRFASIAIGTLAATVTAEAIRDAVAESG